MAAEASPEAVVSPSLSTAAQQVPVFDQPTSSTSCPVASLGRYQRVGQDGLGRPILRADVHSEERRDRNGHQVGHDQQHDHELDKGEPGLGGPRRSTPLLVTDRA